MLACPGFLIISALIIVGFMRVGQPIFDYIETRDDISNIWSQPLSGGPVKQVINLTSDRIFSYVWSNDGKQVAVTRGAETSDLVLITNFR